MIPLTWKLSAASHRYLHTVMPTNLLVGRLRAPGNLKWAGPAAAMVVMSYLISAWLMTTLLAHGAPGWLNLLVLLFLWNAMKFTAFGLVSSFKSIKGRVLQREVHPHGRQPTVAADRA